MIWYDVWSRQMQVPCSAGGKRTMRGKTGTEKEKKWYTTGGYERYREQT